MQTGGRQLHARRGGTFKRCKGFLYGTRCRERERLASKAQDGKVPTREEVTMCSLIAVYAKDQVHQCQMYNLSQRSAWMMSLGSQNLEISSRQITKFKTWDMSRDVGTETLLSCKIITRVGLNAIRWKQRKHRKQRLVCRGFFLRAKSLKGYSRTIPKSS